MMIYKPITEFGKKIASLLRFNDGVRLDIHDYLEEVEPGLKEAFEKVEKWDELQKTMPSEELLQKMGEYRVAERKLEAIKDYRRLLFSAPKGTMMETKTIAKILKKLLEGSEFTTDSDKEED